MIVQINELFDILRANVSPLSATERVPLAAAHGRVLAQDFAATFPAPPYDNSALDGYAFCWGDRDQPLRVAGTIYAGDAGEWEVARGECFKLMTGSKIPRGADSVVRVEHAEFDECGRLLVPASAREFDGVKRRGEDICEGELLARRNQRLAAGALMALASQGAGEVEVFVTPKVAVFSSGNELAEPGQTRAPNGIFNANSSALCALAAPFADVRYCGIVRDEKRELKSRFGAALRACDVVVCSGGASVGDADFMDEVMGEMGFSRFVRGLNLRPGGPTKIYKISAEKVAKFEFGGADGASGAAGADCGENGGATPANAPAPACAEKFVFVLPGNPMSAFVSAFLSLRAALRLLGGERECEPARLWARLGADLALRGKRNDTVCGRLVGGEFFSDYGDKYSPAMTKPLAISNALMFIKKGDTGGAKGDFVEVFPL